MVQPQLVLERVSIFHISIEKRDKNLEHQRSLNFHQMSEPVRELLQKNIIYLWNMKESEINAGGGQSTQVELPSGYKIKRKPTAYLLRFENQEIKSENPMERFPILEAIRTSKTDDSFAKNCEVLAEFYKEESLSRKAFLIISQFLIRFNDKRSENFVAILMTNVRPDLYNTDPKKTFEHIDGEPFEEAFKKGLIFPYIILENGDYGIVKDKVKMFQKPPFTGYFHKFLRLQPPIDPQEYIEKTLQDLCNNGPEISSFKDIEKHFENNKSFFEHVNVDITIDTLNLKLPWNDFKEKICLTRLNDGVYGLLITGSKISMALGEIDLIKEMKTPILSKTEFLKLFKERD